MRHLAIIILLGLVLFAGGTLRADNQTMRLEDCDDGLPLDRYVSYLIDSGRSMNIAAVVKAASRGGFTQNTSPGLNFGFLDANLWLRFTIEGGDCTTHQHVLAMGVPSLEEVDLYVPKPDGGFDHFKSGVAVKLSERPMAQRTAVFPLDIAANEQKTYFMRVDSDTSLIADMMVLPTNLYYEREHRDLGILFFIAGVFATIILANLIFAYSLRNRDYLYFSAFVFTFGMFLATNFGLAHLYLWPEWPAMARIASPFWGSLTILTGGFFARTYIDTKTNFPRLDRVLIVLIAIASILVVLSFIHPKSTNILVGVVTFAELLVTFYTSMQRFLVTKGENRFFWITMLIALLGGMLFILMVFGLINLSPLTLGTGPISVVAGGMLLILTITHRFAVYQSNYRRIFDNVNDVILVFETETKRLIDVNQRAIDVLGYSRAEFQKMGMGQLVDPHEGGLQAVAACIGKDSKADCIFQIGFQKKNGSYIQGELSISPFQIGGEACVLGVLRDVTELRNKEARLRHQQKLESLGTLASGVAHEINNPINVIMNYGELIRQKAGKDEEIDTYSREVVNESLRIADIVANMLQFSRQEEGSMERQHPAEIIRSTLSLTDNYLKKGTVRLVVDLPDELPDFIGRGQQIKQVLVNLITNACDALNEIYPSSDERKVLRVSASAPEKNGKPWLRITVEDNGGGLPEDIRGRIFDPFFTTKPPNKGTGLGLSVSHGIVASHGGELWFDCDSAPGTRFHVDLPTKFDGA